MLTKPSTVYNYSRFLNIWLREACHSVPECSSLLLSFACNYNVNFLISSGQKKEHGILANNVLALVLSSVK